MSNSRTHKQANTPVKKWKWQSQLFFLNLVTKDQMNRNLTSQIAMGKAEN